MYVLLYETEWSPLRSSGQSSWLQMQRSGFFSRHYQIFWEVGLERGPRSLLSTIEDLLGRKSSGSGLESREYVRRGPVCWPRNTLYPQKLVLTLPTNGGRLAGIVRSRTKATEFCLLVLVYNGSVVVKALCYKPEGRGFDSRWGEFLNLPNLSGRTRPWGLLSL
jgi:hypothetical protein